MSYALLCSSLNPKILSWLILELKNQVIQFDPYGLDKKVLALAYDDLKIFLQVKWKIENKEKLFSEMISKVENEPEEVKAFLKVWISQWLTKWRERVRVSQKYPKLTKKQLSNLKDAKIVYKSLNSQKRDEMKKLVMNQLIDKGEICIPELVAKTILTEEIASQLEKNKRTYVKYNYGINSVIFLQSLIKRVKTLAKSKIPIAYMKIKLDVD